MAELTGQPTPKQVNGISFLPTLIGQPNRQKEPHPLYWEHPQSKNHDWAVRMGPWKGVFRGWKKDAPRKLELYNLDADPSEENDVSSEFPEIAQKIQTIRDSEHVEP